MAFKSVLSRPSSPVQRREFLGACWASFLGFTFAGASLRAKECLPQAVTFIKPEVFDAIVAQAIKEDWRSLPMGERIAKFALALQGTPYVGYTLEIDDHIESPSVNFAGLDCWTFFETSMDLARMIEVPKEKYTPSDLLAEIEWTRYRAGSCTGHYLERLHYLDEWYNDNEARGNIVNVTKSLGAYKRIIGRPTTEMTVLWKSYRYLRCNPELRAPMRLIEQRLEGIPFYYIPKTEVKSIEPEIHSGDVIGIVTKGDGGYCSHVGLALQQDGVCHFMHASKNYRKVVVDKSISGYLNDFRSDAGIIVGRPQTRTSMVTDDKVYRVNLADITAVKKTS